MCRRFGRVCGWTVRVELAVRLAALSAPCAVGRGLITAKSGKAGRYSPAPELCSCDGAAARPGDHSSSAIPITQRASESQRPLKARDRDCDCHDIVALKLAHPSCGGTAPTCTLRCRACTCVLADVACIASYPTASPTRTTRRKRHAMAGRARMASATAGACRRSGRGSCPAVLLKTTAMR